MFVGKFVELGGPGGHAPAGTGAIGVDRVVEDLGVPGGGVKMLNNLLQVSLRRQVVRQFVTLIQDAGILNPPHWMHIAVHRHLAGIQHRARHPGSMALW